MQSAMPSAYFIGKAPLSLRSLLNFSMLILRVNAGVALSNELAVSKPHCHGAMVKTFLGRALTPTL